jgi:hypothetical protein
VQQDSCNQNCEQNLTAIQTPLGDFYLSENQPDEVRATYFSKPHTVSQRRRFLRVITGATIFHHQLRNTSAAVMKLKNV